MNLMDKYLNNKRIKNHFTNEVEPHEVFLDRLAQRKEKEMAASNKEEAEKTGRPLAMEELSKK